MMPHQLEANLKTLRLGGMLALTRRLAQARFEEVKTLAEFDFRFNPKIPEPLIRDLATLGFVERAESVILCGPVGVGKSHIAQALGYLACQKGYRVRYVKAGSLLADLGGGHADGTWEQRLRGYLRADLLIVDDSPQEPRTPAIRRPLRAPRRVLPQKLHHRRLQPPGPELVRPLRQSRAGRVRPGPPGQQLSPRPDGGQELPFGDPARLPRPARGREGFRPT